NLHSRSGQVFLNSSYDWRPVLLSGHKSYTFFPASSAVSTGGCIPPLPSFFFVPHLLFSAAFATRRFSKATFSNSIGSSMGTYSCAILASTVQSSPPENSTATLAGFAFVCKAVKVPKDGTSLVLSFMEARKYLSNSSEQFGSSRQLEM